MRELAGLLLLQFPVVIEELVGGRTEFIPFGAGGSGMGVAQEGLASDDGFPDVGQGPTVPSQLGPQDKRNETEDDNGEIEHAKGCARWGGRLDQADDS